MAFLDALKGMAAKRNARNEALSQLQEQVRLQRIVEERQKSSDEREFERFMEEKKQEAIKEELVKLRKERDNDIKFGHNPLDTKNITSKTEFEVLKQKNLFTGGSTIIGGRGLFFK